MDQLILLIRMYCERDLRILAFIRVLLFRVPPESGFLDFGYLRKPLPVVGLPQVVGTCKV